MSWRCNEDDVEVDDFDIEEMEIEKMVDAFDDPERRYEMTSLLVKACIRAAKEGSNAS